MIPSAPIVPAPLLPSFSVEIFDFHLLRRRFLESDQDPPPRPKSLLGPIAYGRVYWPTKDQKQETFDDFTLQPIRPHFYTNHFWCNYRKIGLEGRERSAWHRHLPFELRPQAPLEYTGAHSAMTKRLEATVFLWPYGWSSSLRLSVEGALTREQVEALVEEVRAGKVFNVNGQPGKNSAETLSWLAQRIRNAIGRSDAVESLTRFITPVLVWNSTADARAAQNCGWDKDWAYSRVLSRASEQGNVRIGTNLKDPDFAATLATKGTLLSLSCKTNGGSTQVECAANNMRLFLRIAHVLLLFSQWGKGEPGRSPELDELVRTAQRLLRDLPTYYKNPLCQQILERLPLAKASQP